MHNFLHLLFCFVLCLQRRSLSIVKVFFTHAVSVYKKELRWFGAVELVRRGVLILTAQASNSSGVREYICKVAVTFRAYSGEFRSPGQGRQQVSTSEIQSQLKNHSTTKII